MKIILYQNYVQIPLNKLIHTIELTISQKDIDKFTECSQDINWIHNLSDSNPTPIVHGNLILSKCSKLITFENVSKTIHCGYDFVKYVSPVYSNDTLEVCYYHKGITEIDDNIYSTAIECIASNKLTMKIVCKFVYRLYHYCLLS